MKFDINDYKGKYVMHCKTEEEAIDFCKYLNSIGKIWLFGQNYLEENNYQHHKKDTAYNFNEGLFSDVSWYKRDGYTILEWSDFMNKKFTKADLKTGDVVEFDNGKLGIVITELKTIVCQSGGYINMSSITPDLTDIYHVTDWAIVKVRRPNEACDCRFQAMAYGLGALVYERKEPEEMTLEQVCKELGREIKIIK